MSNSDFLAIKTAKSCLVNREEKIAMSKLNRQPDSKMAFLSTGWKEKYMYDWTGQQAALHTSAYFTPVYLLDAMTL